MPLTALSSIRYKLKWEIFASSCALSNAAVQSRADEFFVMALLYQG